MFVWLITMLMTAISGGATFFIVLAGSNNWKIAALMGLALAAVNGCITYGLCWVIVSVVRAVAA